MRVNHYRKPTEVTKVALEDWEDAYLQSVGWTIAALEAVATGNADADTIASIQAQLATPGAQKFQRGWEAHERWCEVNEATFETDQDWGTKRGFIFRKED